MSRGTRGSEWQTGERCHRRLQIDVNKSVEDGKPFAIPPIEALEPEL